MAVEYLPFDRLEDKIVTHLFSKEIASCYALFDVNNLRCNGNELQISSKDKMIKYDKISINFVDGNSQILVLKDMYLYRLGQERRNRSLRIKNNDKIKVLQRISYSESNTFKKGIRDYKQKINYTQQFYNFSHSISFNRKKNEKYYYNYMARYKDHLVSFGNQNINIYGDNFLSKNIYGISYYYKNFTLKYGKEGSQYKTTNKKAYSASQTIKLDKNVTQLQYQKFENKEGYALSNSWSSAKFKNTQKMSFIEASENYSYKNNLYIYNIFDYKKIKFNKIDLNFEHQPLNVDSFSGYKTQNYTKKSVSFGETFQINKEKRYYIGLSQSFSESNYGSNSSYNSSLNLQKWRYSFNYNKSISVNSQYSSKRHQINYNHVDQYNLFNSEIKQESNTLYNNDNLNFLSSFNRRFKTNSDLSFRSQFNYNYTKPNKSISTSIGLTRKKNNNTLSSSVGLSMLNSKIASKSLNLSWNYRVDRKASLTLSSNISKYILTDKTSSSFQLNYNFNKEFDHTEDYEYLMYSKKKRIYFFNDTNYNYRKDNDELAIEVNNVSLFDSKGEKINYELHGDYLDFIMDEREQYQIRLNLKGFELTNDNIRYDDDGIFLLQKFNEKTVKLIDKGNNKAISGFLIQVVCEYGYKKDFFQDNEGSINLKYINNNCDFSVRNESNVNYTVKNDVMDAELVEVERFSKLDINFKGLQLNDFVSIDGKKVKIDNEFPIITMKNLNYLPTKLISLKKHDCEITDRRFLKEFNKNNFYYEKISYFCKKNKNLKKQSI